MFLFTLPFQLCDTFGCEYLLYVSFLQDINNKPLPDITVPAVAVASFLYLGFIAAGEEIGRSRYILFRT